MWNVKAMKKKRKKSAASPELHRWRSENLPQHCDPDDAVQATEQKAGKECHCIIMIRNGSGHTGGIVWLPSTPLPVESHL